MFLCKETQFVHMYLYIEIAEFDLRIEAELKT